MEYNAKAKELNSMLDEKDKQAKKNTIAICHLVMTIGLKQQIKKKINTL